MNKWFFLLVWFIIGCQNNNSLEEKEASNNNINDLMNIPYSGFEEVDTNRVPKIFFPEPIISFDTIFEGDITSHRFKFFNKGSVPLLIQNIKTTCGCTATSLGKDQILPGDSSYIEVDFNSLGKIYHQDKPIFIISNAVPNRSQINYRGYVIPK